MRPDTSRIGDCNGGSSLKHLSAGTRAVIARGENDGSDRVGLKLRSGHRLGAAKHSIEVICEGEPPIRMKRHYASEKAAAQAVESISRQRGFSARVLTQS